MKRVIGLDIGGANLKASDGEHRSVSVPLHLWKQPERAAGGSAGTARPI